MLKLCESENGTKIKQRCKPVQVSTKERGKTLKTIQVVEDGSVFAREEK